MALQLFYFLTLAGIICCQEVIKMRVKEDEDVILPCSFDSTNIRTETFNWKKDDENVFMYAAGSHYNNGRGGQDPQFKGRVFHFEDQLQSGDASIVIRKTKKTDSGSYSCSFEFHQPKIRSIIQLIVGSSPKPSVTNLGQTKDWAQLECEVQGAFPKPKVQWLDSENNRVPAEEPQETESEGKYNIILKTTVTKSDVYRCVSTQEEIHHQIDQKTIVSLSGSSTGWIVAGVVIVLLLLLLGFVLYFIWKYKTKHEGDTTDKNKSANHEEMELMNKSDEIIVLDKAEFEAERDKIEAAIANFDAGHQNEDKDPGKLEAASNNDVDDLLPAIRQFLHFVALRRALTSSHQGPTFEKQQTLLENM